MIKIITFVMSAFIVSGACLKAIAQNTVNVTQNGSGNSVSINQSGNTQQNNSDDCNNNSKFSNSRSNLMLVTSNEERADTLLASNSIYLNTLLAHLKNLERLEASQQGSGNGLYVILPDSAESATILDATQVGTDNKVHARLGDSPNDLMVKQEGSGNHFIFKPCETPNNRSNKNANSALILQQGTGKSVSISQR